MLGRQPSYNQVMGVVGGIVLVGIGVLVGIMVLVGIGVELAGPVKKCIIRKSLQVACTASSCVAASLGSTQPYHPWAVLIRGAEEICDAAGDAMDACTGTSGTCMVPLQAHNKSLHRMMHLTCGC